MVFVNGFLDWKIWVCKTLYNKFYNNLNIQDRLLKFLSTIKEEQY